MFLKPIIRSYLAATSRQNLETIVEAIRHLEGDHLFNDDASGSRKGQLVEVEIDTEGEAIGCSLVVTSAQDEVSYLSVLFFFGIVLHLMFGALSSFNRKTDWMNKNTLCS
jgi:hypothetical protein